MSLDALTQINAIYDDPTKRSVIFSFFHDTSGALAKFGENYVTINFMLDFYDDLTGSAYERGSQIVQAAYKARKIFELYNALPKLSSAGLVISGLKKKLEDPAYASIKIIFQMPCPYAAPLMPIPQESSGSVSSSEHHLREITRRDAEIMRLKLQQETANSTSLAQKQQITSLTSKLRDAEQVGVTHRQEIASLTSKLRDAEQTGATQRQEITSFKSQVSQLNKKLAAAEKEQELLKQQISSLVARASESERSTPSSSEWQTKCIALDAKLKEALAEKSQLEKKNSELERMKSPTWLSSLLFLFKPVLGFLVFITRPLLRLFGFSH